MACAVVRATCIRPAHASWFKPSRSMSRMVSYSSTVMTMVPSSIPARGPKSVFWGRRQTRRHFLGLGMIPSSVVREPFRGLGVERPIDRFWHMPYSFTPHLSTIKPLGDSRFCNGSRISTTWNSKWIFRKGSVMVHGCFVLAIYWKYMLFLQTFRWRALWLGGVLVIYLEFQGNKASTVFYDTAFYLYNILKIHIFI